MTPLATIETRLATAFPTPSLEALRSTLMAAVSTSADPLARARNITRLAHSTELAALFAPRVSLPHGFADGPRPSPATLAAIAAALDGAPGRVTPALKELTLLRVGRGYLNILETHARAPAPRARVAAVCAILVVAALVASPFTA